MTTHPQHTPTPWKQSGPYIIGQNDLSVAKCTVYKGTNEAKDIENENQAKSNAAFIVRAVTTQCELVTLLKDVLESEYIDHTGTLTPVLHAGDLRGMIVKAIARAEGKV